MLLGEERHLQGQDEQELRELLYVLLLQPQGKRGERNSRHAERLRLVVRTAWVVWCPEFQTTTITLSVCFLGHADAGEALYRGIAN